MSLQKIYKVVEHHIEIIWWFGLGAHPIKILKSLRNNLALVLEILLDILLTLK